VIERLAGVSGLQVVTKKLHLKTSGEGDMLNITDMVEDAVKQTRLKDGIVTVFVPGSTGSVTTIEYEPGLRKDFPAMLERIAPKDLWYEHERMWHDGNGHSHCRASLIGPSLTVPFTDGELALGTWQQIVLLEHDVRSRSREILLQIIGN